jgi:hypothetical protein
MTTLRLKPDELARIQHHYPNRIPIFVTKDSSLTNKTPDITKKKFLAPGDMHLSAFITIIRKYIALSPTQTIFLFIKNEVLPIHRSLSDIYAQYKGADGALHITYAQENTFG